MKELLAFALEYPALLVVPACGFVASLVIVRIKRRYIQEGRLFWRSSAAAHHAAREGDAAPSPEGAHDDALKGSVQLRENLATMEREIADQVWFAGLIVLSNQTGRLVTQVEHWCDDDLEAERSITNIRALLDQWRALKAAIDVSSVPARVRECVTSADGVARELSELVDASASGGSYRAMVHRFSLQVQDVCSAAHETR